MNKVREIREHLKLSQDEVAKKVGISRNWLYQIEIGKANPTYKVMQKLSEVYDVPASEIFFNQPGNNKFQNKKMS